MTVPVALRASTLAALVVLLLQYGLGIDATLYATVPASDHGKSIFPAFGAASTGGSGIVIAHGAVWGVGACTHASAHLPVDAPRLMQYQPPDVDEITGIDPDDAQPADAHAGSAQTPHK